MSEKPHIDLDDLKKSIDTFLFKWTHTNFSFFTRQDFIHQFHITIRTLAEKEREYAPKRMGPPIRINSTTEEGIDYFHRRGVYFLQSVFDACTRDDWPGAIRTLTRLLAVEEPTLLEMHKIHPDFVDFLLKDLREEPFVRVPLWLAETIPHE